MSKVVYAIEPHFQEQGSNFKMAPFQAWHAIGGRTQKVYTFPKLIDSLSYKVDFPKFYDTRKRCVLRFVEACTIRHDCFPEYMTHETIPMIWDCWPRYFEKVADWLKKYRVKAAIFTASYNALKIKERIPQLNVCTITEGIDITKYDEGKELKDRDIDLLEYGRIERNYFKKYVSGINHVNTKNSRGRMSTWEKLLYTISTSKICVALPRCDVDPDFTGGIETLTQRFWEGMLSRCVLIGRAPRELIDLIGYDPVINIDRENAEEQVQDIVAHIEDYQPLVDRNREVALKMAPWEIRMKQIMDWLNNLGYDA